MARSGTVKRLLAAVESLRSLDKARGPLEALKYARRIREGAEDLERTKVKEARDRGVSWREIGLMYDMSKQAAQQRFGGRPAPLETDAAGDPGDGAAESRPEGQADRASAAGALLSRPARKP